jgi:orotidine-5'-phosphate decarboxylase
VCGPGPRPGAVPGRHEGRCVRIYDFCAAIVEATADQVIAFKPQIAYFAAHRAEDQLERLMRHMRALAPQVPVILDAKRGDIGSTAEQYAIEAFERYGADAVTLSPFMGFDSVQPYLKYEGKGAFLLCRTSNPGGDDLQNQHLASVEGQPRLYEHVARLAQGPWNLNGQLGLVVGATYPAEIERVRELAPTLPLLIPGVGAQGGDAVATVRAGYRAQGAETTGAVIVNSSRAVLYASSGDDFAAAARREAQRTRDLLEAAKGLTRRRQDGGRQNAPYHPYHAPSTPEEIVHEAVCVATCAQPAAGADVPGRETGAGPGPGECRPQCPGAQERGLPLQKPAGAGAGAGTGRRSGAHRDARHLHLHGGLHPEPNLMGRNSEERAFIEMADRRVEWHLMLAAANCIRHTHPGLAPLEQPQFPEFGQSQGLKFREAAVWLDAELQKHALGGR